MKKPKGGKRGAIKEWSKSSRRRLREFMLCNAAPCDWVTLGVTCTVPGPALTPDETSRLWDSFRQSVKRLPVGMVWRMEVQARGSVHWHCLAVAPQSGLEYGKHKFPAKAVLKLKWHDALSSLGDCVFPAHAFEEKIIPEQRGLRSSFYGALEKACHVDDEGSRGAWLRYLQDHTSKSKQEQIPIGFGKHWGVIGRDHFETLDGETITLPAKAFEMVKRWRQRLSRRSRPAPGKPFGRKLSWRVTRGGSGRTVWFGNQQTVRRMVEHALAAVSPFEPSRERIPERVRQLRQDIAEVCEQSECFQNQARRALVPLHA